MWTHPNTGVEYDPYDAYTKCPLFYQKVNLIAKDKGVESIRVISKGQWQEPIEKRRLGIMDDGYV